MLGIIGSGEFDLQNLCSHELAPIHTSLFQNISKSKLKTFLREKQSYRNNLQNTDLGVLDGCAILWAIYWPISDTIKALASVIVAYIQVRLTACDVYLTFDRYFDHSPKGCTVGSRHHLTLQSPLPPKTVYLTVTENKVQVI